MSNKIRRPDLEAAPVKYPDYIGPKIFPFLGKAQQGGTMYYQKYQADVAAQYGRNTAALAEISATVMAAHTTTFACQEVRGRFMMSYDQVRGYASVDRADLAMGRVSKRSITKSKSVPQKPLWKTIPPSTRHRISSPLSQTKPRHCRIWPRVLFAWPFPTRSISC